MYNPNWVSVVTRSMMISGFSSLTLLLVKKARKWQLPRKREMPLICGRLFVSAVWQRCHDSVGCLTTLLYADPGRPFVSVGEEATWPFI
jgi:hypothetical protein